MLNFTKYHYLFPYAIAVILAFLLFRSCGKVNTLQDTLKQRDALELSEKHWQDYADSLSKNIKVRIDTLKVSVEKVKIKNNTIFVEVEKVMELPQDSASKLLLSWTSKPVIHD